MFIELDAQVAEAFRNSRAVSTNQGNSYNLMKAGAKRRRTKAELQSQYSLGDLRRTIAEGERVEDEVDDLNEAALNGISDPETRAKIRKLHSAFPNSHLAVCKYILKNKEEPKITRPDTTAFTTDERAIT